MSAWLLLLIVVATLAWGGDAISSRTSTALKHSTNHALQSLTQAPSCSLPCVNGVCLNGVCSCSAGWVGPDCSNRGCSTNCNNKGYCDIFDGGVQCLCFEGFYGSSCEFDASKPIAVSPSATAKSLNPTAVPLRKDPSSRPTKLCLPACGDNGLCVDGKCYCSNGYGGVACERKLCPSDCSGRGICDFISGLCDCYAPFNGTACEIGDLLPVKVFEEDLPYHAVQVNRKLNKTKRVV